MTTPYSARSLHVTLMTPFVSGSGSVDFADVDSAGLATMLSHVERVGGELPVTPIINAEAGEIFSLSREEMRDNLRVAADVANGPYVAGVAGRTSREAVEVAEDAVAAGASALFVLPPFGSADITISWNAVKYPEVVTTYLSRIAAAVGDVPLLVHPTAPRSPEYGIGWPIETVRAVLDAVPTVAGWKMTYSYEGYRRVARFLREQAPHVAILPSSAVRYQENLANRQLDGACSGSFCYALQPMLDHIGYWRAGEVDKATELWFGGLSQLHEYVYSDYSRLHIRYKLATWIAGIISSPFMRDPMPAPTAAEANRLLELMTASGVAGRDAGEIASLLGGV